MMTEVKDTKLTTRIAIFCIIVFILPVILIITTAMGVMRIGLNSMEESYDLDESTYDMIWNPMSIFDHMTASTTDELQQVMNDDPGRLEDVLYLEEINSRLGENSSYFVMRRDEETVYSGLPEEGGSDYGLFAEVDNLPKNSVIVINESACYIQQLNFSFSDGSAGEILIYTDVGQVLPQIRNMVVRTIVLAVLILFIVIALAGVWLYRSIVQPLGKLKTAAENISEGNLNFSLAAESNDEIGELYDSFEQMRIKLRSQIDRNIQYEEDSKELLSNISHDLKTPMTSIKGYIEGLMDGVADTPEKQSKYLHTIYNKVMDMDALIEELYLYSKLDSNTLTYNFAKINLDSYFQDCVDEISMDLESQGIGFAYFNYTDRDTVIIADPEELKRVINNIISNSIKYASPDRKLEIELRITEEPEFVEIDIEDNGRGIAKQEVPLIFDRCYRTDASRTSSQGGSGLGLSIAKKIIEEHGGKIWAVSTEGAGTTICFVIRKYKEEGNYE